MLSRPIQLAILASVCMIWSAQAEPKNDVDRLPSLYWGVQKTETIPKTSKLIGTQENFTGFGFNKGEFPIAYPLKAQSASTAAERYWSVGNRIYTYDIKQKQPQLVHAHYNQMGEFKLWKVYDLALSPSGKYLSFTEVYVDVTGKKYPKHKSNLAIMDLASKKVHRIYNSWSTSQWSPSRDRLAYIPTCGPKAETSPCGGLNLVDADGSKATHILKNELVESFAWKAGDAVLYWSNNTYHRVEGTGEETNAVKLLSSDGNVKLIYDFLEHHKDYIDLYGIHFTEAKDRFIFWVQNRDDHSVTGELFSSLYIGDLEGEIMPLVQNLKCDQLAAPIAEISPGGTKVVIQVCGHHQQYCEETRVINLATKTFVSFKGEIIPEWIDDERLLLARGRFDQKLLAERLQDLSLVSLGIPNAVTYYRLGLGHKHGIQRGDILSVYAKASYNAITGDEQGVDSSSLKGRLILARVEEDQSWAIKYTSNDVELKPGYIVSDGQITGRLQAVETLKERF